MLSVKAPLLSSMRTTSSPPRASTAILASFVALDPELGAAVVADVHLEDPGLPAFRRSAILSSARVPLIDQHAVRARRVREH